MRVNIKILILWNVTPCCLVPQKPAAVILKVENVTVVHVNLTG